MGVHFYYCCICICLEDIVRESISSIVTANREKSAGTQPDHCCTSTQNRGRALRECFGRDAVSLGIYVYLLKRGLRWCHELKQLQVHPSFLVREEPPIFHIYCLLWGGHIPPRPARPYLRVDFIRSCVSRDGGSPQNSSL